MQLANAIFQGISDFDIIKQHFGDDYWVGLHYTRNVYDNFLPNDTWTVVDMARVRVEAKPLSFLRTLQDDATTPNFGMPYASVYMDLQAGFEWMDVRQVEALKYRALTPAPAARQEMAAAVAGAARGRPQPSPWPEPSPDPAVSEENPVRPWFAPDLSIRARFQRILNPLSDVLRLPLTVKRYGKMQDGEVMSYGFAGAAEFGPDIGWKIMPDPNADKAGLRIRPYSFYFDGKIQVSVLRESARYATVKGTILGRRGRKHEVALGYEHPKLFGGLALFRGSSLEMDEVGKFDLRIVPFDFDASVIRGTQIDIGYRYDLSTADGEEAYLQAVRGRFRLSSEFALRDAGNPNAPVVRAFSRNAQTDERNNRRRFEITWFAKWTKQNKLDGIEANIVLPDGTHRVFRSVSERAIDKKVLFGLSTEKTSRKFTVALDQDLYQKGDPASVFVIGEVFEEDSNTSGREINRSIREIEAFIGRADLFPDLPMRVPNPQRPGKTKKAWYGRSSFYYGFDIDRPRLEAFLAIPDARRAALVQALFEEEDSDLVLKRWRAAAAAQGSGDLQAYYESLKALFNDRRLAKPLMYLIRGALAGTPFDYFVTAQNIGFGRVQEHGKLQTPVDSILLATDQAVGLDGAARRLRIDSGAKITDLKVLTNANGRLVLHFNLDQLPQKLYFELSRTTGFKSYLLLSKRTLDNMKNNPNGRFVKGVNELELRQGVKDDLTADLSNGLNAGDFYTITIGYSRNPTTFGLTSGVRFLAPAGYHEMMESPVAAPSPGPSPLPGPSVSPRSTPAPDAE